jgi:ribosomal RNA assembly protein
MVSKKTNQSSPEISEFSYELKIPKDRVAVLIGKKGEVKKSIESETHSRLKIDSKEGDVVLNGKDSIGLYTAREIVHAIGRGFNPEVAQLLLRQDYMMDIINLDDYATTKNSMIRLKGRVIGSEGKSRRVIEELTQTNICIYGKTIAIIGEITNVTVAKSAIEKLLQGGMHSGVYHELEQKRREMRLRKAQEFDLNP